MVRNYSARTVKIMTDGVLENFTGALLEPYCDGCGGHTDNHGLSYVEPDLLNAAVTELDRAGVSGAHARHRRPRCAQRARCGAGGSRRLTGSRTHVITSRISRSSSQRTFLDSPSSTWWPTVSPTGRRWSRRWRSSRCHSLGRERADLQYPFGSIQRSGARLAGGSDWSVTTANPLEEIEVMVNRIDPENRDNAPFLPEERVSLADSIAAFTSGTAYINHDDEHSGRLA